MNLCALSWDINDYNHKNQSSIVQNLKLSEICHQLINQYRRIQKVGLSKIDHLGIRIFKMSIDNMTTFSTGKVLLILEFSSLEK